MKAENRQNSIRSLNWYVSGNCVSGKCISASTGRSQLPSMYSATSPSECTRCKCLPFQAPANSIEVMSNEMTPFFFLTILASTIR